MRLALLGLAASLSTLPLVGQELRLSQSPVTITATFVRTGTPTISSGASIDTVTTPSDTVSYSNKMVLRAVLGADADITGWSLVAVWANWPDVGNAYKFFLRKSGQDPVAVPDTVLKLELTDPYVAQNLTRRSGRIVAGSDTHKSLALLTLGGLGTEADSRRDTPSGIAGGVVFGTGKYERPAGASTAVYRPQSDLFVGYGATDSESDYNTITVRIRIGASIGVAASKFLPTPTVPSEGPAATAPEVSSTSTMSAGVVKGGSGSMTINGGVTVSGSTTVLNSGTLAISTNATTSGGVAIVNLNGTENTSSSANSATFDLGAFAGTVNVSGLTLSGAINSGFDSNTDSSAQADTITSSSAL